MNVPSELIIPLSQFWCLDAAQIFLCDQLGCSDILCGSIPLPHMTTGFDLMLIHMKPQDFKFWELSLPLITKIAMLAPAKWPIWINRWIFLEYDDQDHFLEQLQSPSTWTRYFPFFAVLCSI